MDSQNLQLSDKQLFTLENFQILTAQVLKNKFPSITESDQINYFTSQETSLRFLNARDFNEKKALQMWEDWINWRIANKPQEMTLQDPLLKEQLEIGKLTWYKYDKQKRPCLYYRMKYHVKSRFSVDDQIKFLVFMIEKGENFCKSSNVSQFCIIFDRRGLDKKNYDSEGLQVSKKLQPMLADFYPERLHTFYILGQNWFFKAMFAAVQTIIPAKTLKKVRMLGDNVDLLNYFNKEDLMTDFGGLSDPLKDISDIQYPDVQLYRQIKQKLGEQFESVVDDMDDKDDEEVQKLAEKLKQESGLN